MYTCPFVIIYHRNVLRMKNISDKYAEEIKTQVSCSISFCHEILLDEIMWKTKKSQAGHRRQHNSEHRKCYLHADKNTDTYS